MITLILSIVFWCNPKNKDIGILAIVFSVLGLAIDLFLIGVGSIIDLAILIVNIIIYNKRG